MDTGLRNPRSAQELGAQAFEDANILDFLDGDHVGSHAVIDLPDGVGNDPELEGDGLVAPVEVQAFVAPRFDRDLVAGFDVLPLLLRCDRQVGLVVLARVVGVVEQVLHIQRHDRCRRRCSLGQGQVDTQDQRVAAFARYIDGAGVIAERDGLGVAEIAEGDANRLRIQGLEPVLPGPPKVVVDTSVRQDHGSAVVR